MGMVNMCVDSEKSLEDHFDDILKVLGKGYAKLAGEDPLVV